MLSNIKKFFEKKDYKKLYEEKCKEAENWEFKYNRIYRQVKSLLEGADIIDKKYP